MADTNISEKTAASIFMIKVSGMIMQLGCTDRWYSRSDIHFNTPPGMISRKLLKIKEAYMFQKLVSN
jgi:hypothetical protein